MALIPMAALAAVMMVVAVRTIDWRSIAPSTLRRMPIPETLVMLVTVGVVVATNNLAIGVGVGTLLAIVFFARRVANVVRVERTVADDGSRASYTVSGPLFFASSNDFVEQFRYVEDPALVTVDLSGSRVWDASSVAALDAVETKYREHGASVDIVGLDDISRGFHGRMSGHLNED
jgi:SulP family sulfate permease